MSFGGQNTFQKYSNDFGLGHNGLVVSLNYFDGIPDQSLITSLQSNELILIFKSLLKRDETTKEKALHDLSDLVSDVQLNNQNELRCYVENDIFILCWSQIYAKLVVSESKNIRLTSHLISIKLIKILSKKISKFLKDLVPFILLGCSDNDTTISQTCKKELNECFDNDPKKIVALWNVFQEQVLTLIKYIVVIEHESTLSDESYVDKDLSELRYNRLLTSAVCLLMSFIETNDINYEKHSTEQELFKSILSDEDLWKQINFKSMKNIRICELLLSLIQRLYSTGVLSNSSSIFKLIVRRLLKAILQINSKNVRNFSTVMETLLNTMAILDTYKNGKIWTYEKSSNTEEKITQFLSIIAKHPTPGLFNSLFDFYRQTSTHNFLNDETIWLVVWQDSLNELNNTPFLGKFGAQLFNEFWINYLKFLNTANIIESETHRESDIFKTLANGKSLNNLSKMKQTLVNAIPAEILLQHLKTLLEGNVSVTKEDQQFGQNILSLLISTDNNAPSLNHLLEYLNDRLTNNNSDIYSNEKQLLKIILILLQKNLPSLSKAICEIIYGIPVWIDEVTFEYFSQLIVAFSYSSYVNDDQEEIDPIAAIEDFFLAASSMNIDPNNLCHTLNSLNISVLSKLQSSTDSIVHELINDYIETFDFSDISRLMNNIINQNNIELLYKNALAKNMTSQFVTLFDTISEETIDFLFLSTNFLSENYLNLPETSSNDIFNYAIKRVPTNDSIACTMANSIINTIMKEKCSNNGNILSQSLEIIKSNTTVNKIFFPNSIIDIIHEYLPCIYSRFIPVSNIGMSSYLLHIEDSDLNLANIERLLNYTSFIDSLLTKLPDIIDDNLLIFITLIGEIGNDFNCLTTSHKEVFYSFSNTLYTSDLSSIDFHSYVTKLLTDDLKCDNESPIETLIHSTFNDDETLLYYKSRVLYRVLSNMADSISVTSFISLVPLIESSVTTLIRGNTEDKFDTLIMNCSIVLQSLEKFHSNEAFNKLRTILISEMIGVKESHLVNKSFKFVILLINILSIPNTDVSTIPITSQRLNMALASINKIIDSEVIYELSFAPVRLTLLSLFEHLVQIQAFDSSDFSVAYKLLADSLAMCQLDDTPFLFELRSLCLLLYQKLRNFNNDFNNNEYSLEISDGIIELLFVNFPFEANNQLSKSFYFMLNKVLSNFDKKILLECDNRFFEAYIKNQSIENMNQFRILVVLLTKSILNKQQDATIEFEFEKQQIQDAEEDDDAYSVEQQSKENTIERKFGLPLVLLDILENSMPEDYLEFENKYKYIKYLWDWVLLMTYFKESSYNLCQLFLNQLKKRDLIAKMFSFISEQIDFHDVKYLDSIETSDIMRYDITKDEFSPYEDNLTNECKLLLVQLLFEFFVNVGSYSNTWFINIKDRTKQNDIEKFVSKHISPLLITKELNNVSNSISHLTDKDDALTIKLNKLTNEVKASYLIDEQKLEIAFKLPANYPLTNILVVGISCVGISEQKWKQWIVSAQRTITNMNGSMVGALELFTRNVNLQFSGFEECAICYSILHAVDRKLPTKVCPTCNNKFHGSCLYKWFRSSNNNTCPLCRSEIALRR